MLFALLLLKRISSYAFPKGSHIVFRENCLCFLSRMPSQSPVLNCKLVYLSRSLSLQSRIPKWY